MGTSAVHVPGTSPHQIVHTIGTLESQFREIAIAADGEAMATIEENPGRLRLWDLAWDESVGDGTRRGKWATLI